MKFYQIPLQSFLIANITHHKKTKTKNKAWQTYIRVEPILSWVKCLVLDLVMAHLVHKVD